MRIRRSRVQLLRPIGQVKPDEPLVPSGPSANQRAEERPQLGATVAERRLEVHTQPIIEIATGELAGIDVMLHLPDGRSNPDPSGSRALLPEIGELGDHVAVYGWYLEQAGRELNGWAADHKRLFCSVSIDHRFIADDDFLHTVKEAVRRAGISPSQLLLCIGAEQIDAEWSSLQRLKSHGVQVALEGFTAQSETSDLVRRYPIDVVRLNASLVADSAGAGGEVVPPLTNLVKLAHNHGCRVIAEGADGLPRREALARAGCDLVVVPAAERPNGQHYRAG